MSSKPDNPASPEHRVKILEAHREAFETVRDGEDIPDNIRYKYGQRPLEVLEELQNRRADG